MYDDHINCYMLYVFGDITFLCTRGIISVVKEICAVKALSGSPIRFMLISLVTVVVVGFWVILVMT